MASRSVAALMLGQRRSLALEHETLLPAQGNTGRVPICCDLI
jgi:hypothetical protein